MHKYSIIIKKTIDILEKLIYRSNYSSSHTLSVARRQSPK
uniref:Uncharacterized protein n=1 Tax=Arundo donax TaxID=35708 RepID=A0A0A9A0X0_ARUDO